VFRVTLTRGVTVTDAEAEILVSASATAVTVKVASVCTDGAVYTPVEVITPVPELPPFTSFTYQVRFVLVAFVTVALNDWVLPAASVAEVGEIAAETAGCPMRFFGVFPLQATQKVIRERTSPTRMGLWENTFYLRGTPD